MNEIVKISIVAIIGISIGAIISYFINKNQTNEIRQIINELKK